MRRAEEENIAEHSMQVAVLAHALAVINNTEFDGAAVPERAALFALFHESSEVLTGDLPTPIKYANQRIKDAYKDLEIDADERLLAMLPESMQKFYEGLLLPDTDSHEYKLVKAADKLSALIKCIDEMKYGNSEFRSARKTLELGLQKIGLKEVEFFVDNFLAPFEKTLDELGGYE